MTVPSGRIVELWVTRRTPCRRLARCRAPLAHVDHVGRRAHVALPSSHTEPTFITFPGAFMTELRLPRVGIDRRDRIAVDVDDFDATSSSDEPPRTPDRLEARTHADVASGSRLRAGQLRPRLAGRVVTSGVDATRLEQVVWTAIASARPSPRVMTVGSTCGRHRRQRRPGFRHRVESRGPGSRRCRSRCRRRRPHPAVAEHGLTGAEVVEVDHRLGDVIEGVGGRIQIFGS